jgi:hypothetical protein
MDENILSDKLPEVKIPVYGLFPTPIGVYSVPNHQQLKEEVTTYISMLKPEDVQQSPRSDININVMQLGGVDVLDDPSLYNVKYEVLQAITEVNQQAFAYELSDPINLTDSIIELGNKDAIYLPHEQSNCLYSGYYFVNWDATKHSPVKFRRAIASPHYPIIQYPNNNMTPFNCLDQNIPYKEGDIIIFPSNLSRGYEQNVEGNRITISFNVSI